SPEKVPWVFVAPRVSAGFLSDSERFRAIAAIPAIPYDSGDQFRKYCRYSVSRRLGTKPASRIIRRSSSSVVQLVTPADRTTFSSSITEPTSLPPKRRPSWQTFNPCVTQLDCTLRKFER